MSDALIGCEYSNIIKSEITNEHVKDKINAAISKGNLKNNKKSMDKESVLDVLRKEGVVDCIIQNLMSKYTDPGNDNVKQRHSRLNIRAPGPGQFLSINIVNGTKFAEHLTVDKATVNDRFEYNLMEPQSLQMAFQFVLAYQRQRINSALIPCVQEPIIDQQFFIKITDGELDNANVSSLLTLREPVHLVLIKRNMMTQERWLISSQVIEWRMVLCSDSWSSRLNIDLQGVFDECKVNVGSLEMVLQLVPENHREMPIQQNEFYNQLRAENLNFGSEKERRFLSYAKQWWQEFKSNHSVVEGSERRVKIFAQDENCLNRFVCDYLSPIRAGRIIDSPAQAARFVASIPVQSGSTIGCSTSNHDLWKSSLAFLVENRGNIENHTLLLCSLLLGYGMNAYVAIGVVKDESTGCRPHAWVVTFQDDHPNKATFWEACTGKKFHFQSFPHYKPATTLKFEYVNIGCLFNHFQFFANNFKNDNIEMTVFSLQNSSRWKAMSQEVIASVVDNRHFDKSMISNGKGGESNISWSNRIPLYVSRLVGSPEDAVKVSNDLENQLRVLVTAYRSTSLGSGTATKWDDQLCYILGQALFSYEQEQLTGVANIGNDEFKEAVQRHVIEGHTFKAFPLHVLHTNSKLILDTALKSPVFQEIVTCHGSDVRMALRVRSFTYAEQSIPTWVIFGCTYQFSH